MTTKLQGKALRDVVAEVLTEQEQAERAKAKAEVKHVVEVIQGDLKREKRNQQDHLDAATKATERMKKLQERLKAIKAGDQGALKTPENVERPWNVEVPWNVPRSFRVLQEHEDLHEMYQRFQGGKSYMTRW